MSLVEAVSIGRATKLKVVSTRTSWVAAILVAILVVIAITSTAATALAENPHGAYTSSSRSCQSCHDLHSADGEPITRSASEKLLCYSCHDGSGSTADVKTGFGESVLGTTTARSSHPVPAGTMRCSDCHTPHKGPSEGNPMSLSAGSAEATSGIAVCASCHGSGSSLPGGDLASPIGGTPHASLVSSQSVAGIACVVCHEPHASSNADLVRAQIRTESLTTATVTGEPGICLSCHQDASGQYDGSMLAAAQKHTTVTTSTKALTSWPGASGSPAGCDGCHEPHGTGSGQSYTRVSGSELCRTCHDDASLSYPTDYSYRGETTFTASGHQGITAPAVDYVSVLAETPSFAAWESTVPPTPSAPGLPVSAARAAALLSPDGTRLITSLQAVNGDWDYQTYRFKVPVASASVTSIRVHWEGYGEEAPGYPVALSVWNKNTSAWDLLSSSQMVAQTAVNLPLNAAQHIGADGSVYLMAKARYSLDEALVSGPTVTALSGTSARIDWVTSGLTSSWVDFGTTTSYTQTVGTSVRTQAHSVTATGMAPGVWNFRVRSVAADGSSYTSPNIVHGIPGPGLTVLGHLPWGGTDVERTFDWSAPAGAPGGPFQFRFFLYKNGVLNTSTSWSTETSTTVSLGVGTYEWRVEARDAAANPYGSSSSSFFVWDNTGSCPFLFTWDGSKYVFESDLYGPGKLALKTKSGYSRPTPDDVYVLANEPAIKDGVLDLRLAEERFEVDYLDLLKLYAVDVPADRDVYAEKREAGGAAFPGVTGVLHTVAKELSPPVSAVNITTGQDVLSKIAENDDVYEVLSNDRNTDFGYQTIELDLGDIRSAPQVKIVMDAMSMFPSTVEGATYAATFGARTKLEVQNASGAWVAVPSSAGALPKPPEFSRPYVFDISRIWQSDSRKVRFTFLLKQYIDWIAVDTTADIPVTITEVPLLSADLRARGFDPKSSEGELYTYVYGEPTGRLAYLPGQYTKFGEVRPLLGEVDDKFVIYGGGDELALEFEPLDPAGPGVTRRYAIHTNGYYKDLKTDVAHEVAPLPFAAMSNFPYPATESYPQDAEHNAYLAEWNTRSEGPGLSGMETTSVSALDGALARVAGLAVRVWDSIVAFVTPTAGDAEVTIAEETLHRSLNTDVVALEIVATGTTSSNECAACHAPHGGADSGKPLSAGRAAPDGVTCTGAGSGACHSSAANSASGKNILAAFSAGTSVKNRHDVLPADQRASGGQTACSDCHNPHADNADVSYSDPDSPSQTIASPLTSLISTSGAVYALVGASHDGRPPTITSINLTVSPTNQSTPTVTWTTDEVSTSWIDWGTTTSYELGNASSGSPFGNNNMVLAHSVQMSGLTTGTLYYYRVRSSDALGNTSVSPARTYRIVDPPPAPDVSVATTITGTGISSVQIPVTASSVTAPDGHSVEYQFDINGMLSSWLVSPAWSSVYLYDGTHYTRVRARDSVEQQAISPWSATRSFVVTNAPEPTESCPNLFAWDGERFDFVTDVMGLGPIGVRKGKNVYLNPEPVEDTVIPQGALVPRDGSLDIHLTNERSEIEYIDEVKLVAVDHPAGTRLLINDLHWGPFDGGREPTEYYTVSDPKPVRVLYERNPVLGTQTIPLTDVSTSTSDERDGVIAYSGLYDDNIWTFDLGRLGDPAAVKLVLSGWVDYANKTEKAAWIASGKRPPASFIEVKDANGDWVRVGDAPHPPGYTKTVVYDLTDAFPAGVEEYVVRMRTYMRLNIDYVAVDTTADLPVTLTELSATEARLSFSGTSAYEESPYPRYRFGEHLAPTPQNQSGAFTRYGDVRPLLEDADDRFVIMDTGDDLAMSFQDPDPAADGMERTYVIHTDGFHDTQSGTVDPLPFHAMSSYPYPDTESYPDDDFHTDYLREWNTRIKDGNDPDIMPTQPSGWAVYHESAWAEIAEDEFSVDSDYMVARVELRNGTITTLTVSAGWQSESSETVKPTPASPGTAVDAGTLANLLADDGVYWRTNLATLDTRWNWQVMRFDLGAISRSEVRDIAIIWNGHGEPTAGHPTSVSFWNPVTDTWVQQVSAQMGTDRTVARSQGAVSETFCLRCHDGSPPAGVVFPAGIGNIASAWSTATGDFHGPRAGTGFGSTGLKAPYSRGQGALNCSTCHDTHGSSRLNHVPDTVNGQAVGTITTGSDLAKLCRTCHIGTSYEWHDDGYNRCWCHYVDKYEPYGHDRAFTLSDSDNCLLCHKQHTVTAVHTGANGCDCH